MPSRCCARTSRRVEVLRREGRPEEGQDGRRPRRAVAAPLPLRQRRVLAADPPRHGELVRQAGPDRQHPVAATSAIEVANYKNVFIPTNFDVKDDGQDALRRVLRRAVRQDDRGEPGRGRHRVRVDRGAELPLRSVHRRRHHQPRSDDARRRRRRRPDRAGQLRAHAPARALRQGRHEGRPPLPEAKAVTGGREQWSRSGLEYGAVPSEQNFFQARYAIRHWWTGPIACKSPQRDVWGGPPDGNYQRHDRRRARSRSRRAASSRSPR